MMMILFDFDCWEMMILILLHVHVWWLLLFLFDPFFITVLDLMLVVLSSLFGLLLHD